MLGPWYVNTDARRRSAWGPPCQPLLKPVVIDGVQYKCDQSVVPAFNRLEQIRAKWGFHQNGSDTGFYNCRRMRNDPNLPFSVHAWARALDWDWLQNPAGKTLITNMPRGMIDELQQVKTTSGAFVFMWGGDWDRNPATGHTYFDAMHFEVIAHPLDLATGIAGATALSPDELEDFMERLTDAEIAWLKLMIAGAKEVGSNADSLKTLILDYRERKAAGG